MKKMKNALENYIVVPNGAVNAYKNLGYHVVEENKKVNQHVEENNEADEREKAFLDYITQKPVSEWTKKEITKFAKIKHIIGLIKDEDGTVKPIDEVRKIIADYINSEE